MRDFSRRDRLSSQILRELSQLLLKDVTPPYGLMISFNEIKLTKDLKHGKVFYSVLGGDEEVKKAGIFIQTHQKKIRKLVANSIRIKYMPELTFEFDPSIEREQRIGELLNQIKLEENEEE